MKKVAWPTFKQIRKNYGYRYSGKCLLSLVLAYRAARLWQFGTGAIG